MTYDEALYNSLVDLGYTGSSSDMYRQFLEDRLTAIGAGSYPAISDMLRIWLEDLGYTGTVQEMLNEYAVASGYSNHIEHVLGGDFVYEDIYQLDGVTQYFQLSSTVPLTDDFEIEIRAQVHETVVNNQSFVGGSGGSSPAAGSFTIFQNKSTGRQVSVQIPRVGTTEGYVSVILPSAGLATIAFKRVGQTVTLSVGNLTNSATAANLVAPIEVSQLGRWGTTLIKSGVIADLKIWTGGDRTTGTLVNAIPLTNRNQGAVQQPTTGAITATIINYTAGGWIQQ